MAGLIEQTVWFGPAFTCAVGLIVMVMVELTDPGGWVVKVSVALPAEISLALGV